MNITLIAPSISELNPLLKEVPSIKILGITRYDEYIEFVLRAPEINHSEFHVVFNEVVVRKNLNLRIKD